MRIVVSGRNLAVTDDVRHEAIAKLSKVRRLFDRFIEMDVVFSAEQHRKAHERVRCEVVLHAKGVSLTASATASDVHAAIDQAEARITRQVRKLKTRKVERPRLVAAASSGSVRHA